MQIDRFDWHRTPDGGVLLLAEGREVPVRSVPEDRQGEVAALYRRLANARRSSAANHPSRSPSRRELTPEGDAGICDLLAY